MERIYTVGHSNHQLDLFMELLLANRIDLLIDIRSQPFSRYLPHFNQQPLQRSVEKQGLIYQSMKDHLGGYSADDRVLSRGVVDYEKMARLFSFKDGIDMVIKHAEKDKHVCLMCTEKDPLDCHRGLLVARVLAEKSCEVFHILADGCLETHEEMERRLIEMHFPKVYQMDLFLSEETGDKEKRTLAYRKQNFQLRTEQETEGEE